MMLYQLKYFKGNIFYNTMAMYTGRALSIIIGYQMMKKVGVRATFIRCYALSIGSVLCIYVMQTFFADSLKSKERSIANTFMPILLLIAEGGIEVNFLMCYALTLNYFPFSHKTTAMKWCNLVSRGLTILAPMAAELPGQGPLIIMALTLSSSLLTVQKLQEK